MPFPRLHHIHHTHRIPRQGGRRGRVDNHHHRRATKTKNRNPVNDMNRSIEMNRIVNDMNPVNDMIFPRGRRYRTLRRCRTVHQHSFVSRPVPVLSNCSRKLQCICVQYSACFSIWPSRRIRHWKASPGARPDPFRGIVIPLATISNQEEMLAISSFVHPKGSPLSLTTMSSFPAAAIFGFPRTLRTCSISAGFDRNTEIVWHWLKQLIH